MREVLPISLQNVHVTGYNLGKQQAASCNTTIVCNHQYPAIARQHRFYEVVVVCRTLNYIKLFILLCLPPYASESPQRL